MTRLEWFERHPRSTSRGGNQTGSATKPAPPRKRPRHWEHVAYSAFQRFTAGLKRLLWRG